MKISLNWINDYLETSHDQLTISEGLTDLGLENTYTSIGKSFENVLVGKVIKVNDDNFVILPYVNFDDLGFVQVVNLQ